MGSLHAKSPKSRMNCVAERSQVAVSDVMKRLDPEIKNLQKSDPDPQPLSLSLPRCPYIKVREERGPRVKAVCLAQGVNEVLSAKSSTFGCQKKKARRLG